jgi:hypothetical protein
VPVETRSVGSAASMSVAATVRRAMAFARDVREGWVEREP